MKFERFSLHRHGPKDSALYEQTVTDTKTLEHLTIDCQKSTKLKLDDLYGDYHSSTDSNMRATDAMIGRKRALVCSLFDVGESCNFNLRDSGARVCGDS